MKWFFWTLVFLAFFTPIIFIGKGVDHLDIMKDRYKRALDAGVSSAVRALDYNNEHSMEQAAVGFGTDYKHANNILVDKDNALTWFYRVFYRNLGIQEDLKAQEDIKRYMPMKAIVGFDRLWIADLEDQWVEEIEYLIDYQGREYYFTLSDQVREMDSNLWGQDVDFGISPLEREALVSRFIRKKLNQFLANRSNADSNYIYYINIADDASNEQTENISGVSFIVMAEGMPLPSLNPWKPEKYYAFALGGTELTRD